MTSSYSKGLKFEEYIKNTLRNAGLAYIKYDKDKSPTDNLKSLPDASFLIEPTSPQRQQVDFILKFKTQYILIEARDRAKFQWRKWIEEVIGGKETFKTERGVIPFATICIYSNNSPIPPADLEETSRTKSLKLVSEEELKHLGLYAKAKGHKHLESFIYYLTDKSFRKNVPVKFFVNELNQNDVQVYLFSAKATDLALLVNVNVINRTKRNGYQRYYDEKRIPNIKSFIESSRGFWGNTVILATTAKNRDCHFIKDKKTQSNDIQNSSSYGVLNITGTPGSFKIVDGQHRLFGTLNSAKADSLEIPVALVVFPNEESEALAFLKVDSEQVKLSQKHLMWLFSNPKLAAKIEETDSSPEKKLKSRSKSWASRLSEELGKISAFTEYEFEVEGKTSVWNALSSLLIKEKTHALLLNKNDDKAFDEILKDLTIYFNACKKILPWGVDQDFLYSTGMQVLLNCLRDHIKSDFTIKNKGAKFSSKSLESYLLPWSFLPWDRFSKKAYLGGAGASKLSSFLTAKLNGDDINEDDFAAGNSQKD